MLIPFILMEHMHPGTGNSLEDKINNKRFVKSTDDDSWKSAKISRVIS